MTTWNTNIAAGNWNVAANWLNPSAVPGGGDAVTIGAATVTLSAGYSGKIETLTIGTATLNVLGSLDTTSGVTFSAGTVINIAAGGSFSSDHTITLNGAVINVSGVLFGSDFSGGGFSGSGAITVNGGQVGYPGSTNGGGVAAGSIAYTIENGGIVYFNGPIPTGSSIDFGLGSGSVVIGYGNTISAPITNFGPDSSITVGQVTNANQVTYTANGDGSYTFYIQNSNNGQTNTLVTLSDVQLADGVTPASFTYYETGGSVVFGVYPNVCFLEGTAIATPFGDVAVEALKIGDLVTVMVAGTATQQPVKWLGHRSVRLGDLPAEDAHPIRIKANAFADDVPQRDLLITPEHCILVNGGLIPARLLVNGRSILIDTSISSFTYYHVELEAHGILLAEGLTTESYLDTGNRRGFANVDVTALRPDLAGNAGHLAWENAAAPLTVAPKLVQPVWQELAGRAAALGFGQTGPASVLTTDPDLHIVTVNGGVIRPVRQIDNRYLFMVPANAGELRLVSRAARPHDIAPYIDDRRNLGVLVGDIFLFAGRRKIVARAHLTQNSLSGWLRPGPQPHRWTNGNASLQVDLAQNHNQATMLEIQIVHAGPYRMETETGALDIAAA